MELWIRSQKGSTLKKVDQLYIEFKFTEGIYFVRDNSDILGEYETNKRALEVLDEIQGKITQNECLKTMIPNLNNIKGEEEKIGKLFKEMVYEMPKE